MVELTEQSDQHTGTPEDDLVEGLTGSDVIYGRDGNDTLIGGADEDILCGETGNDSILGDQGTDDLFGGEGDDTLESGAADSFGGADELFGEAGNDVLIGGIYARLYGGDGSDSLTGGARAEGGLGADAITAGPTGTSTTTTALSHSSDAAVRIDPTANAASDGHASGDVLIGVDNLDGSDFGDLLRGNGARNSLHGRGGNDTIEGMDESDFLFGGDGSDLIEGGAGDDIVTGGPGADTLRGGEGNDRLDYSGGSDVAVTVDLETGLVSGGDAEGDVISSFTDVDGTNGSDWLIGDAQGNYLRGWGGADTLEGGAGDDTISSSDGSVFDPDPRSDVMRGCEGDDLFFVDTGGDIVDGGLGFDTVSVAIRSADLEEGEQVVIRLDDQPSRGGEAEGDLYRSVEGFLASFTDASLTVFGGAANEGIWIGGGDDTVFGGDGNATIDAEDGANEVDGGAGIDTARIFLASRDDLTVSGSVERLIVERDGVESIYSSVEIFDLSGGDFSAARLLEGGPADNPRDPSEADDVIRGTDGADRNLRGTAEPDVIEALAGNDRAFAGGGDDTVSGGEGNDLLRGEVNDDVLRGDAGDDRLTGDAGADLLEGGAGDDTVTGGDGADTFLFAGARGDNVITGFEEGDTLLLDVPEGIGPQDLLPFVSVTSDGVLLEAGGFSLLLEGIIGLRGLADDVELI
ncbi:calcium-binding protein [Jannaschia formosa]|uniref:calcium-binding protein n=1 Tax=Jannaschia formosa TaxID=2259592 RepID=UPI000E1B700C|nr:calcium-binding protein [Jannaschia formosa]TFL15954.1 calcium-binding protein [Jannaschia formosa]